MLSCLRAVLLTGAVLETLRYEHILGAEFSRLQLGDGLQVVRGVVRVTEQQRSAERLASEAGTLMFTIRGGDII